MKKSGPLKLVRYNQYQDRYNCEAFDSKPNNWSQVPN